MRSLFLLVLLASVSASAAPIYEFQLTANALDADTGAVIESSTTGGSWIEPPNKHRTDSIHLDHDLNPAYFARALHSKRKLGVSILCGSQPDRCLAESELPGLLEIQLTGFAQLEGGPIFVGFFNLEWTITSLDSGNSLAFSGTGGTTVNQPALDALAERSCANQPVGSQCVFRVDFENLDGAYQSGIRVDITPEPSTGLLVVAGLLGVAGWRRSRA